jgi:hypothetical protein
MVQNLLFYNNHTKVRASTCIDILQRDDAILVIFMLSDISIY